MSIKDAINAPDVNDAELENMSLEELRALADGQAAPAPKRDEAGRFAPKAEPAEKEEESEEEEEEVDEEKFTRTIDLGDGSGVQVFKAPTMEALLDKLAEAQKHATKKIREQAADLKKFAAQKAKDDADNEYVVGQEMLSKPTAAFKKLFKETTGVDIDSFKTKWERVEALEAAQQKQSIEDKKNAAATQFVAAHPEFVTNKQNGARLEKAVNILVADAERTGRAVDFNAFLEEAYSDLSQSGLLELKSNETPEEEVAEEEPKPVVVKEAAPKPAAPAPKRSSGLSSRARVQVVKNTEPSEDDLYAMPLEKLRELGMKQR
jgi:hypothetical protein